MQILVACDKFKGTLTAQQVCEIIREELIAHNLPDVVACPLADGGDGTAAILTFHAKGAMVTMEVADPFFRTVSASYGRSHDGKTAFIEMADASGLKVIKESERNVMKASTWGTGEMIAHALDHGADTIVMGIGGSATNDGGTGMAAALGYEFQDRNGNRLEPVGENLVLVHRIVETNVHPRLRRVRFTALCDVENLFFGEQGAAFVYAPQKGANPQQVRILDDGLFNLSQQIHTAFGIDVSRVKGAGAGGGMGGGAIAFLGATLRRGADVVFEYARLDEMVKRADIVVTGEGKIDEQTLYGKLVSGVASHSRAAAKKLVAVSGVNMLSVEALHRLGILSCWSLVDVTTHIEAIEHPEASLRVLVAQKLVPWLKTFR